MPGWLSSFTTIFGRCARFKGFEAAPGLDQELSPAPAEPPPESPRTCRCRDPDFEKRRPVQFPYLPTGAGLSRRLVQTCILVASTATTATNADILTVDDDGGADHMTIQSAIDAATNGDEIQVRPGVYRGNGAEVVDLAGKLVRIRSLQGAAVTTIDGEGIRRCVNATGGETNATSLEGFTIRNGQGLWVDLDGDGMLGELEEIGGGAFLVSSRPRFVDCVFNHNSADVGGGVHARQARATYLRCSFIENIAIVGGAMSNSEESSATITDCTFSYNVGPKSAAIDNRTGSDPVITNCFFEGHFSISGSCILNVGVSPVITECIFNNNSASRGGAIYDTSSSSSLIRSCTFTGNSSTQDGGAIGAFSSSSRIENCIFRQNIASAAGGAVHADTASQLEITDSTFDRNRAIFGGAISNATDSASNIDGCRFERNRAELDGGSVNSDGSSQVWIGGSSMCGSFPDFIQGTWVDEGGNQFAATCSVTSDLDGDGMIGGGDLLILLANWGPCSAGSECAGDIDGNTLVDGNDLLLLLSEWNG